MRRTTSIFFALSTDFMIMSRSNDLWRVSQTVPIDRTYTFNRSHQTIQVWIYIMGLGNIEARQCVLQERKEPSHTLSDASTLYYYRTASA